MAETPPLQDLIDFPTVFVFRAMGDASEDFADRCVAAVAGALGRDPEHVGTRPSKGDRFLAVRIGAQVRTPAEILAVYAELKLVEGVRLVL